MLGGFFQAKDRREADVGAIHDRAPLVTRLGQDQRSHPFLQIIPFHRVHLLGEVRIVAKARLLHQDRIELRLDRTERDVFTIFRFVSVIEVGAAIEQVDPALVAPLAIAQEGIGHGREDRRAVDHCTIHHLTTSARARMQDSRDHAKGQHHAAAAEIAHSVNRESRLLALAAIGVESAR